MTDNKAFGEQLAAAMRGAAPPPQDEPAAFDKSEIAQRHGLPADTPLFGSTPEEAEADAAARAALAQREQPEPVAVPFGAQLFARKAEANRRLIDSLHGPFADGATVSRELNSTEDEAA